MPSARKLPTSASTNWLAVLLVIVLPLLALWPVCDHAFTSWDDHDTVQSNPSLNPVTLHSINTWWTTTRMDLYVPVTYTTWGIIALFARVPESSSAPAFLDAAPFHTANLVLHLLCCLVVFELLRLLVGATWPSAIGALLFGLHPVQVEAVAWVSGMKDVLGGLLSLIAVWQYLLAAKHHADSKSTWRQHYVLAIVAFILAMLAKPNELVTPAIVWILDVMVLSRSWRTAAKWLWPWFALSAACVITGWIVQPPIGAAHNVAVYLRPFVAIASIGFYARKLLWPINLAVDYGLPPSLAARTAWLIPDALFLVGIALALWFARKTARPLAAGAILFVVALLPVLGFVTFDFQYFSNVADHYLYVPMFGIALMAAWATARWTGRAMAVSAAVVLGAVALVSYAQTQYWADSDSLFGRVEQVNPNSAAASDALALSALRQPGQLDDAIHWAEKTMQLRPDSPLGYIADAMALARAGRPADAVTRYRQAIALDPHDAATRNDLAALLSQLGQLSEAESVARQTISLDPQFAGAHFNLGLILLRQNKFNDAIGELRKAEGLDPRSERYMIILANLLASTGHRAEAIEEYHKTLQLNPQSSAAQKGLDQLLSSSGKPVGGK